MSNLILELFEKQETLLKEKQTIFSEKIELEKMLSDCQKRMNKVDDNLRMLKDEILNLSINGDKTVLKEAEEVTGNKASASYNPKWPNAIKSKYVIGDFKRCVTIREVVNRIKELEPDYNNAEGDRTLMNGLSGLISVKARKGILFNRYKPYEGSEWYYGLKEWFNNESKPFKEYRIMQME